MAKASVLAAVAVVVAHSAALAQINVGGAGGGGGLGDAIVQWFYQSYVHAIAAAGLLALLIGLLAMRSHLLYFIAGGIALLCLGNYQTILGLFNL